jgi:hypothetical protein
MNKSLIISIITLYGAATMGCADDVMGRAPTNNSGTVLGFGLDFKSLQLARRLSKLFSQ